MGRGLDVGQRLRPAGDGLVRERKLLGRRKDTAGGNPIDEARHNGNGRNPERRGQGQHSQDQKTVADHHQPHGEAHHRQGPVTVGTPPPDRAAHRHQDQADGHEDRPEGRRQPGTLDDPGQGCQQRGLEQPHDGHGGNREKQLHVGSVSR